MSILLPVSCLSQRDVTPARITGKRREPELLRIPCGCEDGWCWQPRRGGNDPDGEMIKCDVPDCEDGLVPVSCDVDNCIGLSTDRVDGIYVCEHCAPIARIEAVTERLAALTSWSRAVVRHHMRLWLRCVSGSLEMAEIGREIEEDGLAEWFRLPRPEMLRIAMANEP